MEPLFNQFSCVFSQPFEFFSLVPVLDFFGQLLRSFSLDLTVDFMVGILSLMKAVGRVWKIWGVEWRFICCILKFVRLARYATAAINHIRVVIFLVRSFLYRSWFLVAFLNFLDLIVWEQIWLLKIDVLFDFIDLYLFLLLLQAEFGLNNVRKCASPSQG